MRLLMKHPEVQLELRDSSGDCPLLRTAMQVGCCQDGMRRQTCGCCDAAAPPIPQPPPTTPIGPNPLPPHPPTHTLPPQAPGRTWTTNYICGTAPANLCVFPPVLPLLCPGVCCGPLHPTMHPGGGAHRCGVPAAAASRRSGCGRAQGLSRLPAQPRGLARKAGKTFAYVTCGNR